MVTRSRARDRHSPDKKKRGTRLNTSTTHSTPRERVEEKIVTFLGIKQSWWEVTSPLHAFIMDVYFVGYLLFGLQYEGHPTAIIQRAAVHLLGVSGGVLCMLLCIHTGAFLMMIHDRYREWRDERIREAKKHNAQQMKQDAQRKKRDSQRKKPRAPPQKKTAEPPRLSRNYRRTRGSAAWNERRLKHRKTANPSTNPCPTATPSTSWRNWNRNKPTHRHGINDVSMPHGRENLSTNHRLWQ